MDIELLIFSIVGIISGILSGLTGIGGAVISIPILTIYFFSMGVPSSILMHFTIGTSLSAVAISSLASAYQHAVRNNIMWKALAIIGPTSLLGCVLGFYTANILSSKVLEIIFSFFTLILGGYYLLKPSNKSYIRFTPPKAFLALAGAFIGFSANMLGVSGGVLCVPTLTVYKYTMRQAIGTSSAVSLIIACIGALSFALLETSPSLRYSLGYVYLPAFLGIGATSILGAKIGVKMAHILPSNTLTKLFGIVLVLASLLMLFHKEIENLFISF